MLRTALAYGAGLVFVYLAVSHATEGGKLLTSGASAVSTVAKTFQGR